MSTSVKPDRNPRTSFLVLLEFFLFFFLKMFYLKTKPKKKKKWKNDWKTSWTKWEKERSPEQKPQPLQSSPHPGASQARQPLHTSLPAWEEGSHSGPRARGAGAKESQEIVGHRLLGGDATCFLGCSLKDDEIFLEMLIQFQNGCHIPTAGFGNSTVSDSGLDFYPHPGSWSCQLTGSSN